MSGIHPRPWCLLLLAALSLPLSAATIAERLGHSGYRYGSGFTPNHYVNLAGRDDSDTSGIDFHLSKTPEWSGVGAGDNSAGLQCELYRQQCDQRHWL